MATWVRAKNWARATPNLPRYVVIAKQRAAASKGKIVSRRKAMSVVHVKRVPTGPGVLETAGAFQFDVDQ